MKKTFLTLPLSFLCCWFCGYGQMLDWVWARNAQTPTGTEGWSITSDDSSDVFITGWYNNSITFGSYTVSNAQGVFLAKYDSYGNVMWAKGNSGASANAYCVCTDRFGNSYITGFFYNTVLFDSSLLTNIGYQNVFLVKYDPSGNVVWARSSGGTSSDLGFSVATDPSGNIYLTGFFGSHTFSIGSFTLLNSGGYDIFLAKYDTSGNVLWAKSAGGSSDEEGYSIATDALSNVYITGIYNSPTLTFGSDTLNNVGSNDIFLAKYDSSGNVLWAKRAGGIGNDRGNYVAVDSSGNAYLIGDYNSSFIFFAPYTLTNAGYYDAFLAKYDSSGNVRWVKNIGGSGLEQGYCVTGDKSSKIYVTGYFDSFSVTFDTITLQRPAVYNDPMFIAGYDSSGHVIFAKALASGGDDNDAIAASPSGCIYIGGDFFAVNPFIIGNDSLHLSGQEDVFVAKLCYPGIIENVPEIIVTNEFILYPNPFEDKLNVTAEPLIPLTRRGEEEELTLFDVMGRLLLRCSFVNRTTIKTEQLARGIYFYEIKDKDGVEARGKVVKQ